MVDFPNSDHSPSAGERCGKLIQGGDIGKGIVLGAGEGDAEGVEAIDEGLYGEVSGVVLLCGMSPAFLNRFNSEYLDPSLRWTLGVRRSSGSAS
jgi:hypothetical protein